jgi:hypothetical protein
MATPGSAGHFDLTGLTSGLEGVRRWARAFYALLVLATVGSTVFFTAWGALRGAQTIRIVEIDFLGAVFTTLFVLIYIAEGPSPVKATIDQVSLRFSMPDGRMSVHRWESPGLRLTVKEWNSYHRNGGDFAFIHEVMGRPFPTIPVTPECFSAIISEARRHHLDVRVQQLRGSFGNGLTKYVIRAKRRG